MFAASTSPRESLFTIAELAMTEGGSSNSFDICKMRASQATVQVCEHGNFVIEGCFLSTASRSGSRSDAVQAKAAKQKKNI